MYHESKIVALKKSSTKDQVIGFILIVFLVVGISGMYWIIMQRVQVFKDSAAYYSVEMAQLQQDKEQMDSQLKQYEDSIAEFKKALFKEKDVSLFLSGISAISKENDVSVISIKKMSEITIDISAQEKDMRKKESILSSKDDMSFMISVSPFKVRVRGALDDAISVLNSLEQTKQLLTIDEFSFSMKQYPEMDTSFQINLYGLGDRDAE